MGISSKRTDFDILRRRFSLFTPSSEMNGTCVALELVAAGKLGIWTNEKELAVD
jgi:hypothetical protein